MQRFFEFGDSNGDGAIDRTEADAMRRRFQSGGGGPGGGSGGGPGGPGAP
jgi:hypothetical protein